MTKKELLKSLEDVPDHAIIFIGSFSDGPYEAVGVDRGSWAYDRGLSGTEYLRFVQGDLEPGEEPTAVCVDVFAHTG
jgi:hypothetical protein